MHAKTNQLYLFIVVYPFNHKTIVSKLLATQLTNIASKKCLRWRCNCL